MDDPDYLLALKLQKELNAGNSSEPEEICDDQQDSNLNTTNNLVHPYWETIDPTPDIHTLFSSFDMKFFQGKLQCVSLEWSKRMYSCAGICYSRKNRLGMQCTIRLSEPLLKLRSRKNLIETLLHEMIHAYLFILGIREPNGGHGDNFKKLMHGINRASGTNITVYHTFIDEVDLYKTHWWRCNGICQHRKPFLGYVRRTSNRAPGPNDRWWLEHQKSCGGYFQKIKEPEKKVKSKKEQISKNLKDKGNADIRKFMSGDTKITGIKRPAFGNKGVQGGGIRNGGNTLILRKPPQTITSNTLRNDTLRSIKNHGNLSNVISLSDLTNEDGSPSNNNKKPNRNIFSGKGHTLTQSSSSIAIEHDSKTDGTSRALTESIRDVWSKKFPPKSEEKRQIESDDDEPSLPKKPKKEEIKVDEDVFIIETETQIIDIFDSDEDDTNGQNKEEEDRKKIHKQTSKERTDLIIKEIKSSDDSIEEDDDIMLIDDEYDDDIIDPSSELADTSVIDDLFGEDSLLKSYNQTKNNDVVCLTRNDNIKCPVCQESMPRDDLSSHLEYCSGVAPKKILKPSLKSLIKSTPTKNKSPSKKIPIYKSTPNKPSTSTAREILKSSGYTENEIIQILEDSTNLNDSILVGDNSNQSQNNSRLQEELINTPETVTCPVCCQTVTGNINDHLDICLEQT